jgi:hypothetical protein
MNNISDSWYSTAHNWLITQASIHYSQWLSTKSGKRYLKIKKRPKSPHHHGYSQPPWMDDARNALKMNDEEQFKSIRQGVAIIGHQYGSC